jgi:hypothetical protein
MAIPANSWPGTQGNVVVFPGWNCKSEDLSRAVLSKMGWGQTYASHMVSGYVKVGMANAAILHIDQHIFWSHRPPLETQRLEITSTVSTPHHNTIDSLHIVF